MEDVAARTLGRVAANGIELAYETFGDRGAPPVVLIMGLATQMIAWPDEMCEGLARRGLFVVRFDNGGPAPHHRASCEERADRVVGQPAGRRFLHRRCGHELLGGGLELAFASVAAVPEPDGSTPPMVWDAATLADPAERRGAAAAES